MTNRRRPIWKALLLIVILTISCSTFTSTFGDNASATQEIQGPENNNTDTAGNSASAPADEGSDNQGGNIEAQEAQTADLPFPYVEDAYEVEDFFGAYTYLTDLPLEEVADFYRSEMTDLGYEIEAEAFTGDAYVFSFFQDGSLVTMNVVENADGTVMVRYAEASP